MWSRDGSRLLMFFVIVVMLIAGIGQACGMPDVAPELQSPGGDESSGVPDSYSRIPIAPSTLPEAGLYPIAMSNFDVPVVSGWNLISFPVVDWGSPEKVLDDAGGDTLWSVIKWYNPLTPEDPWKTYRIGSSVNDLTYIDNTMGLWIHITDPGSDSMLVIEGDDPETIQISLYTGWNLVGYPSLTSAGAADSLPVGVNKMAYESLASPYFITDTSDLSSVTLETGCGYWVHSTSETMWDIDNPEPIRQTAEFERMQGVLITHDNNFYYDLGIPLDLIAEMSEDVIIYTQVPSTSIKNQLESAYNGAGVNMANCEWIYHSADSYWTRDYGPWWITNEGGEFEIVDFPYNRPRPNDNDVPGEVASYLGVPMDYMDVEQTGGNYMTDGYGISISTDLVETENPGYTIAEIEQLHQDHLGIDTYHIVPDALGEYIEHIDCWAKFLDVDKIMIARDISNPDLDDAAAYFESQISAYGTPYTVYRVDTPGGEPYTNCLILNDKVLIPQTGSSWDDDAITTYQVAMPGYEIIGIADYIPGNWYDSVHYWESTDALHCRTRGIPDLGMLYIQHIPVIGSEPADEPIEIRAKIKAYSGSNLTAHELYWKLSTEPTYNVIPMSQVTGSYYNAFIPGQSSGVTIQYYIHASDESGRSETNPLIGTPDPHIFTVA